MLEAAGQRFPLPASMGERARRFYAEGGTPVPPRVAATVVLLRPIHSGFEVYALRRAPSMAFASGVYAFPGGAVEPVDGGEPVRAAVREVHEETGVRLAAERLFPWTRWITPEFEPRRFDTYFFVARLPDGEQPEEISGEADHAMWIRPAEALDRQAAGEILLLPPTVSVLRELSAYSDVDAALTAAAGRDLSAPILPRLII